MRHPRYCKLSLALVCLRLPLVLLNAVLDTASKAMSLLGQRRLHNTAKIHLRRFKQGIVQAWLRMTLRKNHVWIECYNVHPVTVA